MQDTLPMHVIATMHSAFPAKFGIPRQSGLVDTLRSTIVFQPEYRNPDALRGLEGFSHLWVVWVFSQAVRNTWSPTVRPPRREPPHGGVCHPVPLPAQPHRPVLRED